MTTDEAENAIIQAFKTFWTARNPAVALSVPDVDFTIPDAPTAWARISMTWSGRIAAGAGRNEDRHTGMAFVELFWPSGVGYKDVNAEAVAVSDWFGTFSDDGGRLQCKGILDGARPYVSTPPREPGFTRRTVNIPVRLMQPL